MKKQPEVTERTKAILMDSFWQLYREKDIRIISIKEITEKAGYNRSTFYQYFVDVYDLLNQLEDSLIQYITDNVKPSLVSPIGNGFIEQLAHLYDSKGEYISVLLSKNGDPMFAEKIKVALSFIILEKLEIKKDKAHMDLMFEFAISGVLSAITKWYNLGKPISSAEMVVMLRSMLYKGTYSYIR